MQRHVKEELCQLLRASALELRGLDEDLSSRLDELAAVLEQELSRRSELARRARQCSREARVYDLGLLRQLDEQGRSQRQIAEVMSRRHCFSVSQSTVSRLLSKLRKERP